MIYLDHSATTPLDPRVLEAMLPHLKNTWGNPSSPHAKGREARNAIDAARETVAGLLGVQPHEVIFVSSGSEGNSLALFGTAEQWMADHKKPGEMVMLSIEHECSLKAGQMLRRWGWTVHELPVDEFGKMRMSDLEAVLSDQTALVSLQWANNEVGTIQPIQQALALCREKKIRFHCDAVQGTGILAPLSPVPDMMTIVAHKFYGPKGIGALIVRDGIQLQSQIVGGGQEFGLRAGTEDTPAIVGMAKALELALAEREKEYGRLTELRDWFTGELLKLPGITLNGHATQRLPFLVNVRIANKDAQTIVILLDQKGICVAPGAACQTGAAEPSHVLMAMGRSPEEAEQNIRFSLGRFTMKEELEQTLQVLKEILQ